MSYFVAFGVGGRDEPVDGDEIASATGWGRFGAWCEGLPEGFDELYYLGTEGGTEQVAQLEQELERAVAEKPNGLSGDDLEVARRLLAAVRSRPARCDAVIVTDGVPGDEGEGE